MSHSLRRKHFAATFHWYRDKMASHAKMEQMMKLTSNTLGFGIIAVAALMLGSAVIADNMDREGMGGGDQMMGGPDFDFAAIDADKDGKISQGEVTVFRAARVAAADANQDGKLSVEEISAMNMAAMEKAAAKMAQRMMDRLDTDGDKLLSAAELIDRPMPADLFERVDTNSDGFIDMAEAEAARQRMAERGRHGKHGDMDGHGSHMGTTNN
jgi:hypothetical protein